MNVFYYVLNFKKFLYVFDVFGRFKNFFSADFFLHLQGGAKSEATNSWP